MDAAVISTVIERSLMKRGRIATEEIAVRSLAGEAEVLDRIAALGGRIVNVECTESGADRLLLRLSITARTQDDLARVRSALRG